MVNDRVHGLITWHYFRNGKLVNSSTTEFEGTVADLQKTIRNNYDEMDKFVGDDETRIIFHDFIPL